MGGGARTSDWHSVTEFLCFALKTGFPLVSYMGEVSKGMETAFKKTLKSCIVSSGRSPKPHLRLAQDPMIRHIAKKKKIELYGVQCCTLRVVANLPKASSFICTHLLTIAILPSCRYHNHYCTCIVIFPNRTHLVMQVTHICTVKHFDLFPASHFFSISIFRDHHKFSPSLTLPIRPDFIHTAAQQTSICNFTISNVLFQAIPPSLSFIVASIYFLWVTNHLRNHGGSTVIRYAAPCQCVVIVLRIFYFKSKVGYGNRRIARR